MSPALPSRTTRTAGVVLALALGLSGCGAGLRAQVYQERTMSDSTNEAIGALSVRHIRVLAPQDGDDAYPTYAVGEDARVAMVLVNEGPEPDRLVSVTSDAAAAVEVVGADGRPATLTVPAQSRGVSQYSFVLRGLTRELRPGQYVEMELVFARNGAESMLVPVELTGTPGPRREGYEVVHTDSNGDPLVEHSEGEEHEGEDHEGEAGNDVPGEGEPGSGGDRAELDNDGGDTGSGDQSVDPVADPAGDENGGRSAAEDVPNEGG